MSCSLSLTPYSLHAELAGNAVNVAFPIMSRQATFTYKNNLGIIGVQLSTTLLATNIASFLYCVLLINQVTDTITFAQDSGVLAAHHTAVNSAAVANFYQPADQVTHYFCPEGYGFHLPANTPVSLYVSTDNQAASYLSAVATLFAIQVK